MPIRIKHSQCGTDKERLDFLLRYISIEDVGDESYCPGVVVRSEALEEALSHGPKADEDGYYPNTIERWGDDMRDVIDRAIRLHHVAANAGGDA